MTVFADSLDIFEHHYGLGYNKRVGNGVIKFKVIQNQIVTKILEADYSLNIQNNYNFHMSESVVNIQNSTGRTG